jgi:hypothetical protein
MQRTGLRRRGQFPRGAMASYLKRRIGGTGRRGMSVLLCGALLVSGVAVATLLYGNTMPVRAAPPGNAKLLLIHGYSDSCGGAFDYASAPSAPIATTSYFNTHGWGGHVVKVGYYGLSSSGLSYESGCDDDATAYDNPTYCSSLYTQLGGTDKYVNDPIRHLACLVAWDIYANYTSIQIPVYVLAHSMGGLVIRDAIAESFETAPSSSPFPHHKLDVRTVVTVATPHGGLDGQYKLNAMDSSCCGNSKEVQDMSIGQNGDGFMSMIIGLQKPQGASGTTWALMAASNYDNGAAASISSLAESAGLNNPYPDGDGVVQADSAVSMQADFKILYGKGVVCGDLLCSQPYTANSGTQYSHEANSCSILNICLASPFFLNDNNPAQTQAWICPSACNAGSTGSGGTADVDIADSGKVQGALHGLPELLALLPPPPPPTPTPTPTATKPPTCSTTTETDNTAEGSYTDYRGNVWYVYYDIKRDTPTHLPCQMRVVVRIFNPAPNGTWNGTTAVWAKKNGTYLSVSFGKVTGSCTYQYHFVWRGPWFSASSGTYFIEDTEYNGSNAYARASGSFSI